MRRTRTPWPGSCSVVSCLAGVAALCLGGAALGAEPAAEPAPPAAAAPAPALGAQATPDIPMPPPEPAPAGVVMAPPPASTALATLLSGWQLDLGGYLHGAYRWIQQPQNYNIAGRNNGFQLEQARLITTVRWRRWLSVRISLEGASEDRLGQSFPGGQLTARLRDAYLTVAPLRWLRVTVGQMVTPWDLDSMRSDAELPFVSRAVPVEGVQPTEGFTTRGLGQDRSLGIAIHSGFIELPAKLSLRYSALLGNGNGQNQIVADNNLPAIFGRFELAYWGSRGVPQDFIGAMFSVTDLPTHPFLNLGVAAQWHPRTSGNLPDLVRETDAGVAADLAASFLGAELQGGVIYLRTTFDTLSAVPDQERFGWWAHARYTLPKIPPQITLGYRVASYAPRAHLSVAAPTPMDASVDGSLDLLYHTIGVFVRPLRSFPVHASLNYTFTTEQAPNQLDNDRFEADVVAVF